MSRISLKTPGSIPNHKLQRNLQLNSKFISNDGGDEGITIDNSGNTTLSAIAEIGSDTDKFLMSDSGVVKYATGANVLSYIGAIPTANLLDQDDLGDDDASKPASQQSIKAYADGINASLGTALAARLNNNADDTMAGTLTIDKNNTATTTSSTYGLKIDHDSTGNAASSNTVSNYGLDIDIDYTGTSSAGSVSKQYGINVDINSSTGSHSQYSSTDNYGLKLSLTGNTSTGETEQYGVHSTITGGDVASQVSFYSEAEDGSFDFKAVSSADTGDYFSISTTTHGATTITTVDDNESAANLTLSIDGDIGMVSRDITLDSSQDIDIQAERDIILGEAGNQGRLLIVAMDRMQVEGGFIKLKEIASAYTDTDTYGQIWVKNDNPESLYFTTGGGDDIQITSGTSLAETNKWIYVQSFRGYTRYNKWWHPSSTYGITYYNWNSGNLTNLPTAWYDSYNPCLVVPADCTLTEYQFIGNPQSAQTFEFALMKGTGVTYGSAGNYTVSQIGSTQSEVMSSGVLYKKGETGLSVSLSEGEILIPCIRRTTTDTSSYYYFEGNFRVITTLS